MLDLSKIKKEDMEHILNTILVDLKHCNNEMCDKYKDMIEDILYCIDDTEAVDIVHSFEPYGEAFSMEKVKEILNKMRVSEDDIVDYYLCMNMFYNDYKRYADSKRLDLQEFCFEMSKMFIEDEDAPDYKVSRFFRIFLEDLDEEE